MELDQIDAVHLQAFERTSDLLAGTVAGSLICLCPEEEVATVLGHPAADAKL